MKVRLTSVKIKESGLDHMIETMDERIQKVGQVWGRALAKNTKKGVLSRIPGGTVWLSIYKEAIEYLESEDGREWAVAGISEIELSQPPADASFLIFGGTDAGQIMAPYNPWPMSRVMGLGKGSYGTIEVRPASADAIEARAEEIRVIAANVTIALRDAGYEPSPLYTIRDSGGKAYIDLVYLARAMELGIGQSGMPRRPHWGPAASDLASRGESWARRAKSQVAAAFENLDMPDVETMSGATQTKLASKRKETWP